MAHIEAASVIIVFILALIGNVIVLRYIYKTKSARTITNYFVCNLALADILFIATCPIVAQIRESSKWQLGGVVCSLLN